MPFTPAWLADPAGQGRVLTFFFRQAPAHPGHPRDHSSPTADIPPDLVAGYQVAPRAGSAINVGLRGTGLVGEEAYEQQELAGRVRGLGGRARGVRPRGVLLERVQVALAESRIATVLVTGVLMRPIYP